MRIKRGIIMSEIVSWFSGGVTSTVATKIVIDKYGKNNVKPIFFETGNHHPDNERFFIECEKWFDIPITVLQDENHSSIYSVFEKRQFINSPFGAPCTLVLKKQMRQKWEKENKFSCQVFGFENEPKEINRSLRFIREYPHTNAIFPLIEMGIDKKMALDILKENGIEAPTMYQLGYSNNNCIGCVKGGMGYWNKIRVDFPEVFEKTVRLEREIGASCIRNQYLDELEPSRGRMSKPYVQSCGIFCEPEGVIL